MAAIKKFFAKKKLDVKFKQAGSGHKLTEPGSSSRSARPVVVSRQEERDAPSFESQRAAEAALSRLQQPKAGSSTRKSQYHYDAMAERDALKDAEQAQAAYAAAAAAGKPEIKDKAPVLASVYFTCPDIGPAVLVKDDIQGYIHEFLLTQLADEPEMASALMIETLNKDKEKVKVCVDTLCKYLDNVITHPDDEKFRKIRISNKAFQDRVASMQGTDEFLQSVGFLRQTIHVDDTDDDFYVLSDEFAQDTDRLVSIKEVLLAAEPIRPQLYRATCVFHPSARANNFKIPLDFYTISPEELKKEQQIRQDAVEKMGMLRTKAMRERDEMRERHRYRYTLVRVRFPNGLLLQGTFRAMEKLSTLQEFVREKVVNDWMPFVLSSGTGHKLMDENLSLAELGLSPAAVVNFAWDATIQAEITAQKGSHKEEYLKPEVMAQIQEL